LRVVLAVGSLIVGQDNWVPLLECDGTHMIHSLYSSVCVLLVGKDGNWGNIPAAIAFVHKDTAELVLAGIKLHDRALFSDRGNNSMHRSVCVVVTAHLKFCALHIFFNVCGHFW
jgi:hypothetical protein